MSSFRILRGNSSRIDTDTTPFHDGYAYFTPDDGGLYIDAQGDDGTQNRVRITSPSGDPSLVVTAVLPASGWSSLGKQTVTISGLGADQNGVVGVSQNITDEQFNALVDANLYVESQSDGNITIATAGDIPACDIPIAVMIFPGGGVPSSSIESGVSTFNGRTGAVLPQEGDYTAAMVGAEVWGASASAVSNHNTSTSAHSDIRSALDSKETAGAAANVQSNLDAHISNATLHVTAAERSTWNAKQDAVSGGASTIVSYNLTANRVLVSNSSGKVAASDVTATELGCLDGVTSNVQTQLNNLKPKRITISLSTSWSGSVSPYTQTVSVSGGTSTCKVDLQPDATAFAHMASVGCNALFVTNNNGAFTAYAVGAKPTVELSVQATVVEVS